MVRHQRSRSPRRSLQSFASSFDPKVWKEAFDASLPRSAERRSLRAAIFEETLRAARAGTYVMRPNWHVTLGSSVLPVPSQPFPPVPSPAGVQPIDGWPTKVYIENLDTLEAARRLIFERDFSNVLVLNLANAFKRGGGVRGGSEGGAQEESLCRRSNLYEHLATVPYPHPDGGGVLSRGVEVFRGPEAEGYPFLPVPFTVDVLSVGAEHLDRVRQHTRAESERFRLRIRRLLQMMVFVRNTSNVGSESFATVLGALGCGAYNNRPQDVAALFAEEMERFPALGTVVFAILDDAKSPEGGSLASFRAAFVQSESV